MTMTEAMETVYSDLEEILDGAGLKNGLSADKAGICYYPMNRLTIADTHCPTFVTYELVSLDNRGKADKRVYSVYATLLIEVWTVKEPTSAQILELVKSIDSNAENKEYGVEVDTSNTYNYNTNNNHISITLRKLIK